MNTPASQLPALPYSLPQSQADWQQVLNALQGWQQNISGANSPAGIGAQIYPPLKAEYAALGAAGLSSTIAELWYPYGFYDRYAVNETPGVTDMSAAQQTAFNLALATGIGPRMLAGTYAIATAPSIAYNAQIEPIKVKGQGWGTQVLYTAPANTAPLYTLNSGWQFEDFLIYGLHANDGFQAGNAGTHEVIRWALRRIISMMQGKQLVCDGTNTAVVDDLCCWPNNPPPLWVPFSPTLASIAYHVYLTGPFNNSLLFRSLDALPDSRYTASHVGGVSVGVYADCTNMEQVEWEGGDVSSNDGAGTEVGVMLDTASVALSCKIDGMNFEGTAISLANIALSEFTNITDGGPAAPAGSLALVSNVNNCKFENFDIDNATIADYTSQANKFIDCSFRTSLTDDSQTGSYNPNANKPPNYFHGMTVNGVAWPERGRVYRTTVAYASSLAPDSLANGDSLWCVATGAISTAMPTHPYDGQEWEITIANNSGGNITPAFTGADSPTITALANGTKTTYGFKYNAAAAIKWQTRFISPATTF